MAMDNERALRGCGKELWPWSDLGNNLIDPEMYVRSRGRGNATPQLGMRAG